MNAIVTQLPAPLPAPVSAPAPVYRGIQLTGMDDSLRAAKVIVASGTAPRSLFADGVDPVAAVWAVIQLGAEVGLSPMASVQNIALINGRPGLYGPAMLAVVEASGKLESIEEWIEGEGDARTAYCRVKRIGRPAHTASFAVTDSKRAGLWDKRGRNGAPGPWQQYPDRMLMMRARSFALKDRFPDVLMGLGQGSAEELGDIPAEDMPPPPKVVPAAPVERPKPVRTFQLKGWPDPFPSTVHGWWDALEAIETDVPRLVLNNLEFLDRFAERFPEQASRIADIRARAAEALTPPGEDEVPDDFLPGGPTATPVTYDPETGEVIEALDAIAQKVAERRGAAPRDTPTEDSLPR